MPNGIVKIGSNDLTPIKTEGQYILYKEGISVRSLQYKGILSSLCLLLTCQYDISGKTVFLFLLAVFCFCLTDLGSEKPVTVIFIYAFGILSLSMPAACFFLPLVSYDLWRYHLCRWHCLFFFFSLYYPVLHPSPLWFCPFVLCVFVCLAAVYEKKLATLEEQMHKLMDDSQEVQNLLKEKNQMLLDNQTYHIRVATLSERNRIAREIHDCVGHLLTRSILQTGALQTINKDASLHNGLDSLSQTLNQAMTSIRQSVHDLKDNALDLSMALNKLASVESTPRYHLVYDVDGIVPKEYAYTFLAVVSEAWNNTQKHSDATDFHVFLREHPGFFTLDCRDNGTKKLPPDLTGIGLTNMKERIEQLGGQITFSDAHGFTIHVVVMKGESI